MSAVDDLFAEVGEPLLQEQLGDAVTYTDADGNASSVTAIVGEQELTDESIDDGRRHKRSREVVLFTDDVPTVSLRGTVTIDSEVWAIEAIESLTGVSATVRVVRDESAERSRPDYRRRT